MTDWMKPIQSVGRAYRPGMEVKMLTAGKGKSVFVDIESDAWIPMVSRLQSVLSPHYAEYFDYDTGETYWKRFAGVPKIADLYRANNVIRKNEDGSYEYVKNRQTGEERVLTEQEVIWLILKAGA
jgi:hypothetical protein